MGQNVKQKTHKEFSLAKRAAQRGAVNLGDEDSSRERWRCFLAKVTVVWGLTAAGCATLQANLCKSARAKQHRV